MKYSILNFKQFIKSLNEQREVETKPVVKPAKPGTIQPTRRRPGPIPRIRPSVKPNPSATAEDVYDHFITTLREYNGDLKFDMSAIKAKYDMDESYGLLDYSQFILEASLTGNPGIPNEPDSSGENGDYLKGLDAKGRAMTDDISQHSIQDVQKFGQNLQKIQSLQANHKPALEDLAERAIRELYGSILDGVELDIKFSDPEELKSDMEMVPSDPIEMEEITDPDVKAEIYKRKIENNIMQGEAKNTKLILNLPIIADELKRIMGVADGTEMITAMNLLTKIAEFFDWSIPMEVQKEMWQNGSGFAGTSDVSWEEEEEDPDDLAKRILADLENGTDILDNDEAEELFDDLTPKIIARGLDFVMLIHEAVKGIYKIILSAGTPENQDVAELVVMNTDTIADELEDLRYGPYIASTLSEFITAFSEYDEIENLKERFFGKIVLLPALEFLELIRDILSDGETAKASAQTIIDEIKQELSDWDLEQVPGFEHDDNDSDTYQAPAQADPDDYGSMSQKEIKDLIDQALDADDYKKLDVLTQYLTESYLRLTESKKYKKNRIRN